MNEVVSRGLFESEVERLRAFGRAGLPGYELPLLEVTHPRLVVGIHRPSGADYHLRIEATDWNRRPASYLFVEPKNHDRVLRGDLWPGRPFPIDPNGGFLGRHNGPFRDDHITWRDWMVSARKPPTLRPMICLRGTREYHEDYRHHRDHWMPISAELAFSFTSMAQAIQERVYRLEGVPSIGAAT